MKLEREIEKDSEVHFCLDFSWIEGSLEGDKNKPAFANAIETEHVCFCVCVKEREREREREREGESVCKRYICVYVCVKEREGLIVSVCVYVCV